MPEAPAFPHRSMAELMSSLDHIRAAPADDGRLEAIVIRPSYGERRMLESARLSLADGVAGDHWPGVAGCAPGRAIRIRTCRSA